MATSCRTASSTRLLVASTSCRARSKRTLSLNPPAHNILGGTASRSGSQCTFWIEASRIRSGVRLYSTSGILLPNNLRKFAPKEAAFSIGPSKRYWLEYLRRNHRRGQDESYQSRRRLSTATLWAFGLLASFSSTTSPGHASSTTPNPIAKLNSGGGGGGGMGPRKTTQPVFIFSKEKAEEDVKAVQEESRRRPYLVSSCH